MNIGHFYFGLTFLLNFLDEMFKACYRIYRILEVFAVYEATKTFDFVAFFVETF
jgi:hypothetical protein